MNIDNRECNINEGEAAVIFPDRTHNYFRTEQRDTDEVILICSPKILGGLFPSFFSMVPKNPIIKKENIPLDAAVSFSKLSPDEAFSMNLGHTLIILSHLLPSIPMDKAQHMPIEDITVRLIEYISTHFKNPLTLDTLAKEFHVSKYYISHIFADKIRMNFRNYLGALRSEYAANLLRTTEDTITDICEKAGFDSQRSFNRIFKTIYNMSPREYRANMNAYLKSE